MNKLDNSESKIDKYSQKILDELIKTNVKKKYFNIKKAFNRRYLKIKEKINKKR